MNALLQIAGQDAPPTGGENTILRTAGSDLQAQMQPVDLSQMPGATPDNPMYIIDTDRPEVQKVETANTPKMVVDGGVLDGVRNPVDVKQVGVVQVSQSGEWGMQLASGSTVPVYVQGGRLVADIAGDWRDLLCNLLIPRWACELSGQSSGVLRAVL